MNKRHGKSNQQEPQLNKQLQDANNDNNEKAVKVNYRQEKFADFLIDVSKYVLTGVIITSLFSDLTDRTMLYVIGLFIVGITLWIGLILTNKRKDK